MIIDRDSALERVECRETEKVHLLEQISNLKVSDGRFSICSSIDVFGRRQTDLLTERTAKSDEISQLKSDNLVISESCTGLQREKEHLLLEVGRLVRVLYRLVRPSCQYCA